MYKCCIVCTWGSMYVKIMLHSLYVGSSLLNGDTGVPLYKGAIAHSLIGACSGQRAKCGQNIVAVCTYKNSQCHM
jgi:hypothetical protein